MRNRRVKLVLDGVEGEVRRAETGIPQGSPAAPILFITYLFGKVERKVEGVKALSFADDISWWADGKTDEEVADKPTRAAKVAGEWGVSNGVGARNPEIRMPHSQRRGKRTSGQEKTQRNR